nr:hypothetical protein [Tanacetum cinerariifolium]
MIVESIRIRFDEIKEVSKTSVANETLGLVPQRQKPSNYDNSNLVPNYKMVLLQQMHMFHHNKSWIFYLVLCTINFSMQILIHKKNNLQRILKPTSAPSTPTYVHAEENNDDQKEEYHLPDDEFTNPFYAPTPEVAESSSHNIGNSYVPTFNQPQVFEYRWTKDHPLEQVRRNPPRLVKTRRQLATNPKMYMFAHIVSTAKLKTIKEAMADSARIEAMQEELHQFDRLQV